MQVEPIRPEGQAAFDAAMSFGSGQHACASDSLGGNIAAIDVYVKRT
jgi:hypothetical protein